MLEYVVQVFMRPPADRINRNFFLSDESSGVLCDSYPWCQATLRKLQRALNSLAHLPVNNRTN